MWRQDALIVKITVTDVLNVLQFTTLNVFNMEVTVLVMAKTHYLLHVFKHHLLITSYSVNWVGVGGFSKMVATFNHVGGSFNLFMATTGDVWIIPSFRIWDYACLLSMFHVLSWIVANISESSLLLSVGKLLSLSIDLFFEILLFQLTFLIFFSFAISSPYFLCF